MNKDSGYGQFCPVAKAAEVITGRWTPLILRELISGANRFNDIHRGVPLMSRALLSQRLKDLQRMGVIERIQRGGPRSTEYNLTEAGEELRPIIVALGVWGLRWVESAIESKEWDAGVLMWDMRRRIDTDALPKGRTVIQFEYTDAPRESRLWWLVADSGSVDLCQSDPGYEVDLYVTTKVSSMARVWIGKESLGHALDSGMIELHGDIQLEKRISRWLKMAVVAEAAAN
jgi:DNA-binding HxlR family transcriptional regulator